MSEVTRMTYQGPGQFVETGTRGDSSPEKALAGCLLRTAVALAQRRNWDPLGSVAEAFLKNGDYEASLRLPERLELGESEIQRLKNALKACAVRKDLQATTTIRTGGTEIRL